MRFQNRRVYVTGATGFIGRYVARALVREGAEVTALVRDPARAGELKTLGVKLEKGNVTEPATLHPEGHDLVIHAAAWVMIGGIPAAKRGLFEKTNVGGTRNVLDAARRADVPKVVHVSSVAAAGRTDSEVAITEETPRRNETLSLYEKTKWEAHRAALESGLDVALPMPGLVLGRGSDFDALFKRFVRGALPFLPKGDAVKGWVHVEDTAEGILLAALKGRGPYILVDENVSTAGLFERLASEHAIRVPKLRLSTKALTAGASLIETAYNLAGKTAPVSGDLTRAMERPMRYDSGKARRELGWQPRMWERLAEDLKAYAEA